ncbi:MAG: alpha/beta fold hydrolase [Kofleriaceae bacterium]
MLTLVVVALIIALLVAAVVVVGLGRRAKSAVELSPETAIAPPPLEGVAAIPAPPPRVAPLPVVLVHGLFGFDRVGVPGAHFDYWRGIAKHLDTLGCQAHAVKLPPAASVPERAKQLVAAIDALGHDRIDLIAHSMGGLDARYAITHLGVASRVRSLVTVGTPHRGTPIADLVARGALKQARILIRTIGIPLAAIDWLTTDGLAKFNHETPDVSGVRYACVVGGLHRSDSVVPLTLIPAHAYLRKVAGPNDGIVPVSSQYWGETLAEIEADHFSQIGWRVVVRHTFDALGLYAFVVARLGDAPAG